MTSLNMNATTVYTRVLAGSKSAEGSCRGSDYIEDEVTYSAVVVEAQFDVKLFQYTALVRMAKGGQPEIKLRGGVSCPYMDGYCDDSLIGENSWKTELRRCLLYTSPSPRD